MPVTVNQVARSTPFDKDTNLFDKDNTQEAIEEINFRELQKEPTGFVLPWETSVSFNNSDRTFTISPTGSSFRVYCHGHVYNKTQESIQITDTEGKWYIYYTSSGALTASQSEWSFSAGTPFIAIIYWDSDNKKSIYWGEERHGLVIDWATHERMHFAEGAKIEDIFSEFLLGDYILNGNGSLDTHAQFSLTNGHLWDEDLRHTIIHASTPTNPFEQFLSLPAKIPVYYKIGSSSSPKWRRIDPTNFAVAYDGTNPIKYNKLDSGTWSLANAANGNYVISWILITNNRYHPIVAILGDKATNNIKDLLDQTPQNIKLNLFSNEYYFGYRLIFRTNTSYSNTPKCILSQTRNLILILEAQDRYTFTAQYIGSAGAGKYLDFYVGSSSDESPFVFPEDSFIRTVTLYCSALSTGTLSFYRLTDLVNPVFSVSLNNESYNKFDIAEPFVANDKLCCKVSSGNFNKPTVRVWIQTSIS